MCVCVYIYIYVCVCVCVCVYIYILQNTLLISGLFTARIGETRIFNLHDNLYKMRYHCTSDMPNVQRYSSSLFYL
jgi:hypothetical protein